MKYLVFPFTDKNRETENYTELWDEVKDQIKTRSGDNPTEYGNDFIKARFESIDDLPLGKILNIPVCIIVVRSVFQRDNNYYPQVLLYECLYEKVFKIKSYYTSCVKFHFCSDIIFSNEISLLIIFIHFTHKWE